MLLILAGDGQRVSASVRAHVKRGCLLYIATKSTIDTYATTLRTSR